MNEEKAREILGDWVQPDNTLYSLCEYVCCDGTNILDGHFTDEELEAVGWWVNNMIGVSDEETKG